MPLSLIVSWVSNYDPQLMASTCFSVISLKQHYPTPRITTSGTKLKHAVHQMIKFQTKNNQAHLREHTNNNNSKEHPTKHPRLNINKYHRNFR